MSGQFVKVNGNGVHWNATMKMASGFGPVFSREGRFLGIVSGSFNDNDVEHGVYILPYSGIYGFMKTKRSFIYI